MPGATERRKFRHVPQLVDDRLQTQQRAVTAWGVEQWGHRHIAIGAMVAARRAPVNAERPGWPTS